VTDQRFSGFISKAACLGSLSTYTVRGFQFWLGQMNRYPIRTVSIQHALVCSFITLAEYQLRFGPVVSQSNAECPQ
jgi:hypothetical protein